MLQLKIQTTQEGWDDENGVFIEPEFQVLEMEHSLISLSKWESKWCKSFLNTREMSYDETVDYIKCMTLNPNINPEIYNYFTQDNVNQIRDYINAPMTATVFSEDKTGKNNREVVTAELIYYWMIALNIPFECQHWHLNRLLTLVKVCNIKNTPPKKRSKRDIMSRNAALNAARRQQLNTNG